MKMKKFLDILNESNENYDREYLINWINKKLGDDINFEKIQRQNEE